MISRFILLFTAVLLVSACGGRDRSRSADAGVATDTGPSGEDAGVGSDASGGSDGGGTSSAWETYCTSAGPERTMRCNPGDTFEVTGCLETGACLETLFVEGALDDVAGCLTDRPCEMGDDYCYAPDTHGRSLSPAAEAFATSCMERRAACAAGTAFHDDFCFPGLASDETIARVEACLEATDCNDVRLCLIDVYTCGG